MAHTRPHYGGTLHVETQADPWQAADSIGRRLVFDSLTRVDEPGGVQPALAVRWILDQGPTIALWGARRPEQLDPVDEVAGWSIDEAGRAQIEAILQHCIKDPVSPEFMAPPSRRP